MRYRSNALVLVAFLVSACASHDGLPEPPKPPPTLIELAVEPGQFLVDDVPWSVGVPTVTEVPVLDDAYWSFLETSNVNVRGNVEIANASGTVAGVRATATSFGLRSEMFRITDVTCKRVDAARVAEFLRTPPGRDFLLRNFHRLHQIFVVAATLNGKLSWDLVESDATAAQVEAALTAFQELGLTAAVAASGSDSSRRVVHVEAQRPTRLMYVKVPLSHWVGENRYEVRVKEFVAHFAQNYKEVFPNDLSNALPWRFSLSVADNSNTEVGRFEWEGYLLQNARLTQLGVIQFASKSPTFTVKFEWDVAHSYGKAHPSLHQQVTITLEDLAKAPTGLEHKLMPEHLAGHPSLQFVIAPSK